MKVTHAGQPVTLTVDHLYVAGWTGRDAAAVQHHIDELAALGVAPPSQVPLYYRVSNGLLTQSDLIEVQGEGISGEVEPELPSPCKMARSGLGSRRTIPTAISRSIPWPPRNRPVPSRWRARSGRLTR